MEQGKQHAQQQIRTPVDGTSSCKSWLYIDVCLGLRNAVYNSRLYCVLFFLMVGKSSSFQKLLIISPCLQTPKQLQHYVATAVPPRGSLKYLMCEKEIWPSAQILVYQVMAFTSLLILLCCVDWKVCDVAFSSTEVPAKPAVCLEIEGLFKISLEFLLDFKGLRPNAGNSSITSFQGYVLLLHPFCQNRVRFA